MVYFVAIALSPRGEIYLDKKANGTSYIVEVKAKELPKPFFGTSFHIVFDNNNYIYNRFSLGSFFATDDDVLVQVAQKDNSIIVGLSLKRGHIINKTNGVMLKLFFTQKPHASPATHFSLTNGVYSTYKNGRENIDSIKFKPDTINN